MNEMSEIIEIRWIKMIEIKKLPTEQYCPVGSFHIVLYFL